MEEPAKQQQKWWQKAMKPLGVFGIIVVCILILALFAVIVMAYIFNVNVPGLRGKTLWDWLQLLIVPLALAVIALVFQLANTRTERQIAKERYDQDQQIAAQRYEQDQQIALDKQREDLLQAYLDRMTELLLEKQLRTSEPDSEVRNVVRARTLTVLPQLDAQRKRNLMQFLSESKLLEIINLSGANLDSTDLSRADLSHANLSRADLNYANLSFADLSHANLSRANLNIANLNSANLSGANLSDANLSRAALGHTTLNRAALSGAYLDHAYLSGAKVTDEQLAEAKSLKGATMPDGSTHS